MKHCITTLALAFGLMSLPAIAAETTYSCAIHYENLSGPARGEFSGGLANINVAVGTIDQPRKVGNDLPNTFAGTSEAYKGYQVSAVQQVSKKRGINKPEEIVFRFSIVDKETEHSLSITLPNGISNFAVSSDGQKQTFSCKKI